jgi:hypothetical protein
MRYATARAKPAALAANSDPWRHPAGGSGRGHWLASKHTARRKWEAKFGHASEVTEYDLQVEVQGDNLTVTVPGAGFRAVYYKPLGQPQLIQRQRTETDDYELLAQVWQRANDKARELGWIV